MNFTIIVKNFSIILLTIIAILVLSVILNFIIVKALMLVRKYSIIIADKYLLKIKCQHLLLFSELTLVILFIIAVLFTNKNTSIVTPIYFLPSIAMGSIIYHIKKEQETTFSLIDTILDILYKKEYLANLLERLSNQGNRIMTLLISTTFTFLVCIKLEWPAWVYYMGFLSTPVYLNILIYCSYNLKLQERNIIAIRRLIVYAFLGVLIIKDTYTKFYSLTFYDTAANYNLYNFYIYIITAVFFAIERLLQVVITDYRIFIGEQF